MPISPHNIRTLLYNYKFIAGSKLITSLGLCLYSAGSKGCIRQNIGSEQTCRRRLCRHSGGGGQYLFSYGPLISQQLLVDSCTVQWACAMPWIVHTAVAWKPRPLCAVTCRLRCSSTMTSDICDQWGRTPRYGLHWGRTPRRCLSVTWRRRESTSVSPNLGVKPRWWTSVCRPLPACRSQSADRYVDHITASLNRRTLPSNVDVNNYTHTCTHTHTHTTTIQNAILLRPVAAVPNSATSMSVCVSVCTHINYLSDHMFELH